MGRYTCQECQEHFNDIGEYSSHLMLHSDALKKKVDAKKKGLFGRLRDAVRIEVQHEPVPPNPDFMHELQPPSYKQDTREKEVLAHMDMNRHFLDMSLSMQKMERYFENVHNDVKVLQKEIHELKDGKRVETLVQQHIAPEVNEPQKITVETAKGDWDEPSSKVKVSVKLEGGSFKQQMEVWNFISQHLASINIEVMNQD